MQYCMVIWFTGFHLSRLAECYLCVCSDAQSCLTLCDPMVCNLPGFPAYGILQARILEWGAISSSK